MVTQVAELGIQESRYVREVVCPAGGFFEQGDRDRRLVAGYDLQPMTGKEQCVTTIAAAQFE
jgi:hypothetical protein